MGTQRTTNLAGDKTADAATWSVGWRAVVSVAVLMHLAAVTLPPLSFATRTGPDQPPSPAVFPAAVALQPYSDAAYLNHGYAFFAPNPPGASSLLRYRVEFDDGRPPIEGVLPDLSEHRPRLYYHRHFMLSEQLSARSVPPLSPDAAPGEAAAWRAKNADFQKVWRSFRRHLLARYGGDRVTMEFVDHRPPGVLESLDGVPLNDPSLYRPRSERWKSPEPDEFAPERAGFPGGSPPPRRPDRRAGEGGR